MESKQLKKILAGFSIMSLITGSALTLNSCASKKSTSCSGTKQEGTKTSCSGTTSCSGAKDEGAKTSCSGGSSCSGTKTKTSCS